MAIIALHNSHNSGMRWSMEHLAERALHSTHNLEFLMTLQKERAGGGGGEGGAGPCSAWPAVAVASAADLDAWLIAAQNIR